MRVLACLMSMLLLFSGSLWASTITISAMRGEVAIISKGQRVVARPSVSIHQGDRVDVGSNAWATLKFSDGGSFTLRSGSSFTVDSYQFKADGDGSGDNVLVTLVKGSLRAISGLVAKGNTSNYAIRTPTATVGVRGTDHDVIVVTEGEDSETEPGTYNTVNDGATFIRTADGELQLERGQTAGVGLLGGRPRLLQRLPRLLQRIKDDDLRNGIREHLKDIHQMMEDGTFRIAAQHLRELRQLRGPKNRGKRREVLQRMVQEMDAAAAEKEGQDDSDE